MIQATTATVLILAGVVLLLRAWMLAVYMVVIFKEWKSNG